MRLMILSVLFHIVFLAVTLVWFATMCVAFALTVPFDRERVILHRLSRLWSAGCIRAASDIRLEGRENIEKGRPYVVVANHRSMLDIVLMYVLPLRSFKWVSKKEVYRWPIFGWVLWMHGDVAIRRGSAADARRMIRDGAAWLGRGVSMIVFPEGSRSGTDNIGRFHDGAFRLAKEAGVPVLPVVTTGTGNVLDGWKVNFRNVCRVRILPPVDSDADPKELAQRVRDIMAAEHGRIMND